MMDILDELSKILGNKKKEVLPLPAEEMSNHETTTSFNQIFNIEDNCNSKIEISKVNIGGTHFHFHLDTKENIDIFETEIAKKVTKIEEIRTEIKYSSAVKSYNDLLLEVAGKSVDDNDLFLIFNGLLNCYINLNDKEQVYKYIEKIESLKGVEEIHKFHYLCSVFYFNQRDINKSYSEVIKAVEYKSDYFKALCFKVLVEYDKQIIDYNTSVSFLIDGQGKPLLGTGNDNDNSHILNILGDISMLSKKYDEAISYFEKSYKILPSPVVNANLGIALFYKAVESHNENEKMIYQKDVDYKVINRAISIFDELFNYKDEEVRSNLRRIIASVYYTCLYLVNNFGKINSIFNEIKDYASEKSEIYRLKAISEAMEGRVSPETLREVSSDEAYWLHLLELLEDGLPERIINEIEPFIFTKFKDEQRYHTLLLQAYLNTGINNDEFMKHLRNIKDYGIKYDLYDFFEAIYYEKTGDIPRAATILKDFAEKSADYTMYLELISFYERNSLLEDLEILFDDLITNKGDVVHFVKNKIYYRYFLFLLRNKQIVKAYELYVTASSHLDTIQYEIITARLMYIIGDFKKAALSYGKLYDLKGDHEDLFSSAVSYLNYNNIEKSEELINQLIRKGFKNESRLYSLLSNIEILKNDIEKAYEYAKMAKDFEEQNPYSDVHPFYVSRSIRCNMAEGIGYVGEYTSNYPNNNKWVKSVKAIEKDQLGNDILAQEFKTLLDSQAKRFNEARLLYLTGKLGISILAHLNNLNVIELLKWRQFYNIKISINNGVIEEVNKETTNFCNQVIIDALGLYVLAEIECLDILNSFKTVKVTYSTIQSLQLSLWNEEDSIVREILLYINKSLNVDIVCPSFNYVNKLDNKIIDLFFKDQIDSAICSFELDMPYIYTDFYLKTITTEFNVKFINMISFLRALQINGYINAEKLSEAILKLKKGKYNFINFNPDDIYNIAKRSNFEIDEDIKYFFILDKNCNYVSFINVYIEFLKKIYGNLEKTKFNDYVDIYIELFDQYTNKIRYEFFLLEVLYPDSKDTIRILQEKCSLSSLYLFEQLFPDKSETKAFEKIKFIMIICEGALRRLLDIFKYNQVDYDYYSYRVKEKCMNIDKSEIELIISESKKD